MKLNKRPCDIECELVFYFPRKCILCNQTSTETIEAISIVIFISENFSGDIHIETITGTNANDFRLISK